jgi:hypothetical protein
MRFCLLSPLLLRVRLGCPKSKAQLFPVVFEYFDLDSDFEFSSISNQNYNLSCFVCFFQFLIIYLSQRAGGLTAGPAGTSALISIVIGMHAGKPGEVHQPSHMDFLRKNDIQL